MKKFLLFALAIFATQIHANPKIEDLNELFDHMEKHYKNLSPEKQFAFISSPMIASPDKFEWSIETIEKHVPFTVLKEIYREKNKESKVSIDNIDNKTADDFALYTRDHLTWNLLSPHFPEELHEKIKGTFFINEYASEELLKKFGYRPGGFNAMCNNTTFDHFTPMALALTCGRSDIAETFKSALSPEHTINSPEFDYQGYRGPTTLGGLGDAQSCFGLRTIHGAIASFDWLANQDFNFKRISNKRGYGHYQLSPFQMGDARGWNYSNADNEILRGVLLQYIPDAQARIQDYMKARKQRIAAESDTDFLCGPGCFAMFERGYDSAVQAYEKFLANERELNEISLQNHLMRIEVLKSIINKQLEEHQEYSEDSYSSSSLGASNDVWGSSGSAKEAPQNA